MKEKISINFLPNAVYQPELCIRTTILAAEAARFPLNQIMFEGTEGQQILVPEKLLAIFKYYRGRGFVTAIDDFGAGYAGLTLRADFQPNFIKIEIHLVRDIDTNHVKQAVVKGIILTGQLLGVKIIVEGVETAGEVAWFVAHGIALMQGFYFAKPGFEKLPEIISWQYSRQPGLGDTAAVPRRGPPPQTRLNNIEEHLFSIRIIQMHSWFWPTDILETLKGLESCNPIFPTLVLQLWD